MVDGDIRVKQLVPGSGERMRGLTTTGLVRRSETTAGVSESSQNPLKCSCPDALGGSHHPHSGASPSRPLQQGRFYGLFYFVLDDIGFSPFCAGKLLSLL